jgi:hypothetical protein
MKKKPPIKVPSYVTEIATSAHILADMHGGYWKGEHPLYPRKKWLREIKLDATRMGYWEWAASWI